MKTTEQKELNRITEEEKRELQKKQQEIRIQKKMYIANMKEELEITDLEVRVLENRKKQIMLNSFFAQLEKNHSSEESNSLSEDEKMVDKEIEQILNKE